MIPRAEAKRVAEKEYEEAAQVLEKKIDGAITKNTGGSIYVDISGVPGPAVSSVKTKYEAGGWTVNVSHDQRDGSCITLS